jgi:K+-sensing histidine kinase KdpD
VPGEPLTGGRGLGTIGGPELSLLAHALNNPLTAIMGYSELLLRRDDDSILEEAPRQIHAAAASLRHVIDNLIAVLALDAGAASFDLRPVEIAPAVERAAMEAGNVQVALDARPLVLADELYLRQLLSGVLRGARRLAGEGAELRVRLETGGRLTVTAGAAPAAEPERVFALAAGLDLYAARQLAEQQGGSLSAETAHGDLRLVLALQPAGSPSGATAL